MNILLKQEEKYCGIIDALGLAETSGWQPLKQLKTLDTRLLAILLCATLFGCGGSSTTTNNDDSGGDDTQTTAVDITNAVFTENSFDCADYEGAYTSAVVYVNGSQGFDGTVDITAGETSCLIASNNIPNHDFVDNPDSNPGDPSEQDLLFTVSRSPALTGDIVWLWDLNQYWDAVFLNGTVVNILTAGCWNGTANVPGGCDFDDPYLILGLSSAENGLEQFIMDSHNGHVQPGSGAYHYHGEPMAMYDDNPGPDGSPLIGFAADGFPIYGPYFLDDDTGQVREAVPGWTLKTGTRTGGPGGEYDGTYVSDWEFTDAGDLDECNGMTVDGNYQYHVTEAFPHTVWCFKGSVDPSFAK
ncbi:MAG: YHYH protein [Pseudomonadota bacterium]